MNDLGDIRLRLTFFVYRQLRRAFHFPDGQIIGKILARDMSKLMRQDFPLLLLAVAGIDVDVVVALAVLPNISTDFVREIQNPND